MQIKNLLSPFGLTIFRLIALPILLICSWGISTYFYRCWTNYSKAYVDSFVAFPKDDDRLLSNYGFTFSISKRLQAGGCEIKAFSEGDERTLIWTLVTQANSSGVNLALTPSILSHLNNSLAWSQAKRGIQIVTLEPPGRLVKLPPDHLFRFNRNVSFELPLGPLRAQLKSLAVELGKGEKTKLDERQASDLAALSASYIDECHNLSSWGERSWFLRLVSGSIEELIVILSVYCILVFLFEMLLAWRDISTPVFAIKSAEEILDLVPYVGFFGTIFGMSGALWILGAVDISDPIQKATQVGPITGNISLAMETSTLGLIFFIFASLVLAIVRIAFNRPA